MAIDCTELHNASHMIVACFNYGLCFSDETMWTYIVAAVLNLYGIVLFAWWWKKAGNPSSVYMLVTFLYVGSFVESMMSLYARVIYFIYGTSYWERFIIDSAVWPFRRLLTNAALFVLAIHMTHRAWSRRRTIDHQRRNGDNG